LSYKIKIFLKLKIKKGMEKTKSVLLNKKHRQKPPEEWHDKQYTQFTKNKYIQGIQILEDFL
jgi:hypothetical protein